MPGLSAGMTSTPRTSSMSFNPLGTASGAMFGSRNTPATAPPPPQFSPGPYGTAFQYNPGGITGGYAKDGQAAGFNTIKPGWYPVEKPRTQADQIAEEMEIAKLRRMNIENDQLLMGGVPRTGTGSSSSSSGSGPAPSISQLVNAIKQLQPPAVPGVTSPAVPGAPIAAPTPADNATATAAAYGRAKDKIALEGNAATKAMQGAMTARGISGTGIEAKGRKDITRASLGALGQVARDQAIQDVEREDAFSKLGYTGGITQRGQDIQAILSKYNADLMQRGQNINAQYNPLGYIGPLTALSMAGGSLS